MKLQLTDLMPIGKYKGYPIDSIITGFTNIGQIQEVLIPSDKQICTPSIDYLDWFNNNVEQFEFSKEIINAMEIERKRINKEVREWERQKANRDFEVNKEYSAKSKYNRVNQNRWDAGGMNTDYQEAGMSIQDMGYSGDGW